MFNIDKVAGNKYYKLSPHLEMNFVIILFSQMYQQITLNMLTIHSIDLCLCLLRDFQHLLSMFRRDLCSHQQFMNFFQLFGILKFHKNQYRIDLQLLESFESGQCYVDDTVTALNMFLLFIITISTISPSP
jgi:hypothetical protein